MKLSQLSLADYNKLDSIPVINQDLSASGFTPVANTYYRHTGATTDTFTQGVIYLYDTEYKALDGSGGGGISDVKVNGTSVVTDGVANIVTVGRTVDTEIKYILTGRGKSTSAESDYSHLDIQPYKENCIVRTHPTYGTSVAMFAPPSWSSGTSGSLTLTEGGTYQFYSGSGAMIINYTLLYVELGKDSIAYAGKNVQLEIDTNNVVHIYDMSQEQPVEKTITLKYRRIGI